MACSGSRETDLGLIYGAFQEIHSRHIWATADQVKARTHWYLAEDHLAIDDLIYALADIIYALGMVSYIYDPFYPEPMLYHFLEAHTAENGAVDMDAILSAMWDSAGGQTMTFITYIDAMRGSISEKTVFEPYLASYLKHFL